MVTEFAHAFEILMRSLITVPLGKFVASLSLEGLRGITTPVGLTYWRDDPLTLLVVGHVTVVMCDSTSRLGSY